MPQKNPQSRPASPKVWAGFALACLSVPLCVGGFRVAALLFFAFEFHQHPYDLLMLPLPVLAIILLRSGDRTTQVRLRSWGTTLAVSAMIMLLLIAALIKGVMGVGGV